MSDYKETDELQEEVEYSFDSLHHAQSITFDDIKAHLTGPVISVIVHIIVLSLCGSIVLFEGEEAKEEMQVEIKDMDIKAPEEVPPPPEEVKQEELEDVLEDVQVDAPTPDVTNAPVENVANLDVQDVPSNLQMEGIMLEDSNSALKMNFKGMYAVRGKAGRRNMLKKYNVSSNADRSVTKALSWLAKVQSEDGSWDKGSKRAGLSGLATLCFLAHGDTPMSDTSYSKTSEKAIMYLVRLAEAMPPGGLIGLKEGAETNGYGHAIATYALSEAYAMTKIPRVGEAMNKGIERCIQGMNSAGSYDYHMKKDSARSDLSLAGWNYQAMKAAKAAGCHVEGLEPAIEKAISAIVGVHLLAKGEDKGLFNYENQNTAGKKGEVRPAMTAVATLCLQLFGKGKMSEAVDGAEWLSKHNSGMYLDCDFEKSPKWPLYHWYYQTQVLFQAQAQSAKFRSPWQKWKKSYIDELVKRQSPVGYWEHPGFVNPKQPVWGFKTAEEASVYTTAFATLMLEVFYRYLPTGQAHKASGTGSIKDSVVDDAAEIKLF